MNTDQNADNSWETPRYNRRAYVPPPVARRAEPAPTTPRRPTRNEDYPALVKGAKKPVAVNLESRFNDLAREMEEERIRQELADAAEEAARIKRQRLPAGMVLMPPPPQTIMSNRFRRCDGLDVQPAPMEYREADWDPLSEGSSEDEHEQNTDLADKQDRH
jgi:hypothetical protein